MKSHVEAELNRWLAKNHGVLTIQDAAGLGISRWDLYALIERGRLARRHAGVYVEVTLREGARLADGAGALAAAGSGSALSHRTAAWRWELLTKAPGRVDLLVPYGIRSGLAGVTVHRSRVPFHARSKDGLRLTDPVRTIVDIAASTAWLLTDVLIEPSPTGSSAQMTCGQLHSPPEVGRSEGYQPSGTT